MCGTFRPRKVPTGCTQAINQLGQHAAACCISFETPLFGLRAHITHTNTMLITSVCCFYVQNKAASLQRESKNAHHLSQKNVSFVNTHAGKQSRQIQTSETPKSRCCDISIIDVSAGRAKADPARRSKDSIRITKKAPHKWEAISYNAARSVTSRRLAHHRRFFSHQFLSNTHNIYYGRQR